MLPHYMCKEHGIPFTNKEKESFQSRKENGWVYPLKFVPHSINIGDHVVPVLYNSQGIPYIVIKYAVGQPMGALSSWAMLAITHHLLVQMAFRRAFNIPLTVPLNRDTWYDDYELLGDDIILFDKRVASAYLDIMASIGVPINTSKSVCAKTAVAEFAKVTTLNGMDVSALSWKMFMSGNTLMGRANTAYYLLNKGYITKAVNPWIDRFVRQTLYKAGNPLPSYIAIWTMLSNRNIITVEEALSALIDGTQKVFRLGRAILFNADANKIRSALPGLLVGIRHELQSSKRAKLIWNIEKPWFGIQMWKPLAVFAAKGDPSKDAEVLTKAMLERCSFADTDVLGENPLVLDYGSFYVNGAPSLTGEVPNVDRNDQVVLYGALYNCIYAHLERMAAPLLETPCKIDSPIPDMVLARESLDRYNELLLLNHRAELKLDPDTEVVPPRNIRPSELRLISLLRKSGSRPLFTTAASLF